MIELLFRITLISISIWQLYQGTNGELNVIIAGFNFIFALGFLQADVKLQKYFRAGIMLFLIINLLFGFIINPLGENEWSFIQKSFKLLLFISLIFSFAITYFIKRSMSKPIKTKYKIGRKDEASFDDKVKKHSRTLKKLYHIWKHRKTNGWIIPLSELWAKPEEQEINALTFTLGREVEFDSSDYEYDR